MSVDQAISRVRRAMPRNADVMLICDDWERLGAALRAATAGPKVDRRTYMREFMRKRRATERRERKAAAEAKVCK